MPKHENAITTILAVLTGIVMVMLIFIYSDANLFHYTAHMDPDAASEGVLAKVIWENGMTQPDTWYMSTGKEIIAAANLAPHFYDLVGQNLNLSMGIACTVMLIALVAAMLFFDRQMGLSPLQSFVMVVLCLSLSAPAGEIQRMLYLYGVCYLGLFLSMFFVIGVYGYTLRRGKFSVLAALALALSAVCGLEGMHASVFIFMPLLGAEILRRLILILKKEKCTDGFITIWAAAMAVISLLVSMLLGMDTGTGATRNIRNALPKFTDEVIPNFLSVLGYGRLTAFILAFVVMSVVGVLFSFKDLEKNKPLFSMMAIPAGIVVIVLSTTFTTAEVAPRYYLCQIFFVAVGTSLFMHYVKPDITRWVAVLAIIYGLYSGFCFYDAFVIQDKSSESEYVQMTDWMYENGYSYGYATFDHANTMTIMCNDRVEIRPVSSYSELQGAKWLSDKSWYPPFKDQNEPVCYVVSKSKNDEFLEYVNRQNPEIIDKEEFESYIVYVTDHDYTLWVD